MRTNQKPIVVLGIGGGGVRIVSHFAQVAGEAPFEIGAADTDIRSLEKFRGGIEIPLGVDWGCSTGCGGDMLLGEKAVGASTEQLTQFIEGAGLLIVAAGLGGGTGAGGVRTIARLAREADIPCFFVVTMPFSFEGNWRRQQAQRILEPLRQLTDSVIVVKNDLLFTTLDADTPANLAFDLSDELLAKCIHGLASTAWADWMLTADFAAIRGLLREFPEDSRLGIGCGNGENRWQSAIEEFVQCPLIGGPEIIGQADAAVVILLTRREIMVGELQTALNSLQKYFPEDAKFLLGACVAPFCSDEIQVTGVICQKQEASISTPISELGGWQPEKTDLASRKIVERGKNTDSPIQAELPLQEQVLGIFSGIKPTTLKGENLDIPTFQRRGIHIDAGD